MAITLPSGQPNTGGQTFVADKNVHPPGRSLRLFIAIEVPDGIKARALALQGDLRNALGRSRVRWAPADQWHLTLKFLGAVAAAQVSALEQCLDQVAAGCPALGLSAKGLGAFPNVQRPRVLWVGVDDQHHRLRDLAARIEEAVAGFTAEKPEDRFHGHLTLGRINDLSRGDLAGLRDLVSRVQNEPLGTWTTEGFDLIRSELSPAGARHSVLRHFCFRKTDP